MTSFRAQLYVFGVGVAGLNLLLGVWLNTLTGLVSAGVVLAGLLWSHVIEWTGRTPSISSVLLSLGGLAAVGYGAVFVLTGELTALIAIVAVVGIVGYVHKAVTRASLGGSPSR